MGAAIPFRDQKYPRPLGAKIQAIAILDPQWVRHLETMVDWKLHELTRPKRPFRSPRPHSSAG